MSSFDPDAYLAQNEEKAQGFAPDAYLTNAETQQKGRITSGFKMGLKDPISGGAQLLPRGLEFLSSAGGLAPNRLSEFFGSEARRVDEMVKGEEQAYQESRQEQGEEGFDWSRLGGNILNPINLIGGAGAARLAATKRPVAFAAGVGATGGALQPVYGEGDFGTEKTLQTGAGAVGGVVGKKVIDIAGGALNPLVSKAEQTMRDLGVQLTPGQLLGKQPKALEEFAQNMPLVGSYISNAKERQLFQFNKGVINKALNKIGEELPADVVGRDAINEATTRISNQYTDVLSRVNFELNPNITSAMGGVVRNSKLTASGKQELNDLIDQYVYQMIPVNARGSGKIDGKTFKSLESDLMKKISSLRSSALDSERSLGEELGRAADVLKTALRSQNPTETSALRRIDSAYGDLTVMRTAAANTGAENGVFTPKHYQQAVRMRDQSRSKSAFAAGTARGQDISDAAMDILNPEVQTTVQGRLLMGLGGVYGAAQNLAATGSVVVATPAIYSQQGLKVMESLMRSRPEIARKIGKKLSERAKTEGSITGAEVLEEYNRATRMEQ